MKASVLNHRLSTIILQNQKNDKAQKRAEKGRCNTPTVPPRKTFHLCLAEIFKVLRKKTETLT